MYRLNVEQLLQNKSMFYIWNVLSCGIGVYGLFVLYLPNLIPNALSAVYRYGKTASLLGKKNKSILVDVFTLPKSWFKHFYIVACIFHTFLLWTLYQVYFKRNNSPEALTYVIRFFSTSGARSTSVLPEDVVIALLLMILQVFRRFIECHFISVYSDAKISLLHYGFGMFFYVGVGLSLIIEAPGFQGDAAFVKFTGAWLTAGHVTGAILFLYGWYIELESHLILADIRKSKEGKLIKNRYSIPEGGMFDYVSCPHYFGEVTMYFALCFVYGWKNYTWIAAFGTVLINQIMAALMSHEWYKSTFKNYPSKRKALLPFLL